MFNPLSQTIRIPCGPYPQSEGRGDSGWEGRIRDVISLLTFAKYRFSRGAKRIIGRVMVLEAKYRAMPDDGMLQEIKHLRYIMRRHGIDETHVAPLFAIIREFARRTIGMEYFSHQVEGAWALMNGMVVEMDTGQGKSFCATLAACSAAVTGIRTYIVTVNEYLAERDVAAFHRLYSALGLTVTYVAESMSEAEKRACYECDIVYCTNKQLAFDYLRDRVSLGNKLNRSQLQLRSLWERAREPQKLILPGLGFAIVDEADSILIDEAVTPLIISASKPDKVRADFYRLALALADQLKMQRDFQIPASKGTVYLTDEGLVQIAQLGELQGGPWMIPKLCEELMLKALRARHCLIKDKHYIVQDGKIQIVDEFTGRILPDRSWETGLQQMVELKEACELSAERVTLASLSYQRFFRKFINLAGMTGTAREVRRELGEVYGLESYRVAPAQKNLRRFNKVQICAIQDQKWRTVVDLAVGYFMQGKAVLIGTCSVAASEIVHEMLNSRAVAHQLLNARNDRHEAEVVACAGNAPAITIATNMAGRGTDIKLSSAARKLGGLHVIATELHPARRIDRQLYGRCARQGDPGVVDIVVSLEDERVVEHLNRASIQIIRCILAMRFSWIHSMVWMLLQRCQKNSEYQQVLQRNSMLRQEEKSARLLAFSGGRE